MATIYMKSNEVRQRWGEVLEHVLQGDTVNVDRYGRIVARVVPVDVVREAINAAAAAEIQRQQPPPVAAAQQRQPQEPAPAQEGEQ